MISIKLEFSLKKTMILISNKQKKTISFLYFTFLIYILFFIKRRNNNQDYRDKINIYPFYSKLTYIKTINWNNINCLKDFLIDVLGNILLFIPLPIAFFWLLSIKFIFFNFFLRIILMSTSIEILQFFFNKGVFDIDDIILNSIGGYCGLLILFHYFFKNKTY